jgi:zinc transport system substrate-binding protein
MRFVLLLCSLLAGLAQAGEPLSVYTVNYPLQYFAQRIGGDQVRAVYPGPRGQDPAHWRPSHEVLRAYKAADLILLNGAGYSGWVDDAHLPDSRTVDTSKAFVDAYIRTREPQTERAALSGNQSRAHTASFTWLDLYQATQQAEAIMEALAARRPQSRAVFDRNYQALKKELMALDLAIQRQIVKHEEKPLFVSPPVYQYFARRYRIHLQSFPWQPDVLPDEDEWQRLVYAQESFPAEWMLWASAPRKEIVSRLQSLGIQVIVFDPCATAPAKGDFMSVMRDNVAALGRVFN